MAVHWGKVMEFPVSIFRWAALVTRLPIRMAATDSWIGWSSDLAIETHDQVTMTHNTITRQETRMVLVLPDGPDSMDAQMFTVPLW